jgi:hypothetical protein
MSEMRRTSRHQKLSKEIVTAHKKQVRFGRNVKVYTGLGACTSSLPSHIYARVPLLHTSLFPLPVIRPLPVADHAFSFSTSDPEYLSIYTDVVNSIKDESRWQTSGKAQR